MQSLVNFRDLGGYETLSGKRIKPRKVLRSAQPVGLVTTDKDELLTTYQLKTIIDFRSEKEVMAQPVDALNGVAYQNIDIMQDAKVGTTSQEDLFQNATIESVDAHMLAVYKDLVLNPTSQAGYADFLNQILLQKDGAVLFHCFAGKDRTGIGAALVLGLLGVSQSDILHDYLLTNVQRQDDNAKLLETAKSQGLSDERLPAIQRIMSVDQSYLKHAVDQMTENFGSLQAYATQALAFERDKQDELLHLLLTD